MSFGSPILSPLPLQNLQPRSFIQEIVDFNHGLNRFLWRLPPLPDEGIVELLW